MKASKGEEKIIQLLHKSGYRFEREKRFKDLKHGMLRFDFYVYGAGSTCCVIEYQGQQHFVRVNKFHRTRAEFVAAQERDRRKISYCLAHGIPIYCIPYWELDNLHTAADIFQPKFRAYDMWKNDKDYTNFLIREKFDKSLQKLI
jgi:hypothetical protein